MQYKSFRANWDVACAYTMRDVFICSRAARDYSASRRTYETEAQMRIIRDLDERCRAEASIVEEALIHATTELASGAAWVSVRGPFSQKFLVHGENFCNLNRELGERMQQFRSEALGEMWDLCRRCDALADRNPTDPERMAILARMEKFCLSKPHLSNGRTNEEIAAELVVQGFTAEDARTCMRIADADDVDAMRCLALAAPSCALLDASRFDKEFFRQMREEMSDVRPTAESYRKVVQASFFDIFANQRRRHFCKGE